ncbi:MAG: hypothetical protein ACJ79H_01090, partial [Myxococcales bacterium]
MNGEGQRPPNNEPQAPAHDTPEPGNARYPQHAPNGQQPQPQQAAEAGGRRRFRRQRRGGRGRGRNKGHHQNVPAPLDAQGRILDVENELAPDDGAGPEAVPQPGEPQAAAGAGEPQGSQTGADIAGGPSAPPQADAQAAQIQAQAGQPRLQQQNQHRAQPQQQRPQPRQEPSVAIEGVLDVDHRGNGRLRNPKYNFLPQQDDVDVPRHIIDRDRLRAGVMLTGLRHRLGPRAVVWRKLVLHVEDPPLRV